MTIYTVKAGDTLYAVARKYGVTADTLAYDNQIEDPQRLVRGQSLYIPVTSVSYRVKPGDSLYGIARSYGVTLDALLRANPTLSARSVLYPGQTVTVPFPNQMLGSVLSNGFSVSTPVQTLRETLPYLTYVSPFSWQADAGGGITPPKDAQTRDMAAAAHTAALLCVTNIPPQGGFSSEIAHALFTDGTAQAALLTNLTAALRQGNYAGVIFDFEYIYPSDRENYNAFLRRATDAFHRQGYLVMTALAPKLSGTQIGTLYEAHDYRAQGEIVDNVIIMTYEWGYIYGPPMAVSPIDQVRKVFDYAVTVIPSKKILMGMPNYGYDWTLPFVQGSAAKPLSNTEAVALAADAGADIEYDEKSQAPFFNYYDAQKRRHEVWFDDARSIQARLRLIDDYDLGGLSYWTIDDLFRAQFLVLSSMYRINKFR